MARKIPARLVLELLGKGMSAREIQRTRHIAPQSVAKVRDAAEERRVGWEDVAKMDEAQVYELLFPREAEADKAFLAPDYAYARTELQKTGATMQLLHGELKDEAAARGLLCKSHTTFCRGYADYVAAKNVTNHLEHKPGQVMEADWSGAGMRLVDPSTGEATKVHLFVACLPCSQTTYVEGTLDMRQNTWPSCHANAWAFYGGVAVRTVRDNLKTGVVKRPREGEVVLNEACEALGRHCMTAITPTQVRKPEQKAGVEGSVGRIATAVVARLRSEELSTLDELNKAVRREPDAFNARPFQKRDGPRAEVFEEAESALLAPLPRVPFEVSEWLYGRCVSPNLHISFEKNSCSAPCGLVGKRVDAKAADSAVEIYRGGGRVATHPRLPSFVNHRYPTDPSHMPPEFVKAERDETRIMRWAADVGPATRDVVAKMFGSVQIKEQACNPALAVLNLSKRYAERDLESACAYALAKASSPRCPFLKSVLARNASQEAVEEQERGGCIRGERYCNEGGEALC